MPPEIYADAAHHLRDVLWCVWLRVQYQIRRSWELGTLPRVSDQLSTGIWSPTDIHSIFTAAEADHTGEEGAAGDAGAAQVLEAFLEYTRRVDARTAASLAAGVRLPLCEIARRFELSPRQQAALTFALMAELDPKLLVAYRYLGHDPTCRGLDARLLATLVYDTPESRAHLARDLSSSSPLLHFRLLEQDEGARAHDAMLYRRLRPASRLVQMLVGETEELDPQLYALAELRGGAVSPALFPEQVVARARTALGSDGLFLVVQGQPGVGKRLLLQVAAAQLGRRLILVDGRQLVGQPIETLHQVLRGLQREARLLDAVLVFQDVGSDPVGEGRVGELPEYLMQIAREHRPTIGLTVSGDRLPPLAIRPVMQINVGVPSFTDQQVLWRESVPGLSAQEASVLAERFALPGGIISLASRAARVMEREGNEGTVERLDRAVRQQLHNRLIRLGRQLETPYAFDDLVVEDEVVNVLREIVSRVIERRRVREEWGFRGPAGVSVLFSGEPGVGKTMGATVLARQLGLELYEIDLSMVMSKWLGETEKNLSEVFDAAEPGHVVLLFNEADTLFGKRTTEVKSANDRYANLETNYLLQRIERFGGLAILTTNLTGAIDAAFRRRFAYDVRFNFPSPEMRAVLWRRAIPSKAVVAKLDFGHLSERYELSGGFIKVAAERAAFIAAGGDKVITQQIVIRAIEQMYRERGKIATTGRLE